MKYGIVRLGASSVMWLFCMQAFLHMVKLEQERAEQQQKRDEEALRRRKEHVARIKRMLEAAFDGDIAEIRKILKEVSECFF